MVEPSDARVHITIESEQAEHWKTVSFPLADTVGALAALATCSKTGADPAPALVLASPPALKLPPKFHATGDGFAFSITAYFDHAVPEHSPVMKALETWACDVFCTASVKISERPCRWCFARQSAAANAMTLIAWVLCASPQTSSKLKGASLQATMCATALPDEMRGAMVVLAEALKDKDERLRCIDAILQREDSTDAVITRNYGHFRRFVQEPYGCIHMTAQAKTASSAFDVRMAMEASVDGEAVMAAVTWVADSIAKLHGSCIWHFVWTFPDASRRIVSVLARAVVPYTATPHYVPVVVQVRERFSISTFRFTEGMSTSIPAGVIEMGASPIPEDALMDVWARAVAHQSPEEQVRAFNHGWMQRNE